MIWISYASFLYTGDVLLKEQQIRMAVDENDVPRMEFLNEKGEITYSLPPEE
jgi:hypothetical protein